MIQSSGNMQTQSSKPVCRLHAALDLWPHAQDQIMFWYSAQQHSLSCDIFMFFFIACGENQGSINGMGGETGVVVQFERTLLYQRTSFCLSSFEQTLWNTDTVVRCHKRKWEGWSQPPLRASVNCKRLTEVQCPCLDLTFLLLCSWHCFSSF